MLDVFQRLRAQMDPVRARAKVLARADRELRAELVRLRREAGLTQSDIAERLGISQQAVYKLERYDADPRQSTLQRYANAVGAIVEHRVTIDHGQSVRMASDTEWVAQGGSRHTIARRRHSRPAAIHGWSDNALASNT